MLLVGRSSSHFTRLPRLFAEELGVPLEFKPIFDMKSLDDEVYAGNPALKLPILRTDHDVVFGALNICRTIAARSDRSAQVVWPEDATSTPARNAQEMVWHGMAAQVQLVMGTVIAKLPADNIFFVKAEAGFVGSLKWLEQNIERVLIELPSDRMISVLEASLFCLIEHLQFRPTVALDPYPTLLNFTRQFAARPSAQRTPYVIDQKP